MSDGTDNEVAEELPSGYRVTDCLSLREDTDGSEGSLSTHRETTDGLIQNMVIRLNSAE